jgi:UDP-N-acetylmuramoyl-L-alanyl-D-glutamate--2,6-diaminopimelate ligase
LKNLKDILSHVSLLQSQGEIDLQIGQITADSRQVKDGDVFVAMKGWQSDGHEFISQAIQAGARVIVCEQWPTNLLPSVTYLQVADAAMSLGMLCAANYDFPSKGLKVVGVTGTNGKTTCATLMYQLFSAMQIPCGLISTVENKILDQIIPATHTTPDAPGLQRLLRQMLDAGCTHVFMEVSSHAIHQQRIAGLEFAGACFTNITHDHLDYHHTFEEYIRVKKLFFDHLPPSAFALSNIDDKRGTVMLQNTTARKRTYALKLPADYKGKILENNLDGLYMHLDMGEVYFRMIGEFNAYNLLCVYAVASELGFDKQEVLQVMSTLKGAEGRFDYLISEKEQILGIVDYAHTPDALINVLATINKLRKGNETLFTIVGCGGDRDRTKRPLMAMVACEHSNRVIFTSDNPRSENPQEILKEMEMGVPVHQRKKYVCIADRREAIKTAVSIAEQGDIILLAGKGHEKYQEINGVKNPFDDKSILHEMFEMLEK